MSSENRARPAKSLRPMILAAWLVVGAVSAPSAAAVGAVTVAVCEPLASAVQRFAVSGARNPRLLTGHVRDRLVALVITEPPSSPADWDLVYVADMPTGGGLLAVGREGLICASLRLDARNWRALLRFAEGEET